jgi:hypothetical protein
MGSGGSFVEGACNNKPSVDGKVPLRCTGTRIDQAASGEFLPEFLPILHSAARLTVRLVAQKSARPETRPLRRLNLG